MTPEAIEACGRRGVRAAIILAVGFAESGDEGTELQERLLRAVRLSGVRIVGPNTSGLLNLRQGLNLVGTPGLVPGPIGILSQSGNVALALMNEGARTPKAGVSVYVGVGNEADIGFHEYLEVLAEDDGTEAIVMYADGIRATGAFLDTAARVTPSKPIVLLKGGRSPGGSTAVLSHTGALAGDYEVLSAGLRQAGVVEVTREDELLPVALTLANQPPGAEGGIAILSDGGGQNALACDLFHEMGCPVAVLEPETQVSLRKILGPAAAVRNPVDVAGAADSNPGVFADALQVLVGDSGVAGVLLVGLFGGYHLRFSNTFEDVETKAAMRLMADSEAAEKPVVVHSMYANADGRPLALLREGGVPVTSSLEIACRCAEVAVRRRDLLSRPPVWQKGDLAAPDDSRSSEEPSERPVALTEWQAREELSAHGVHFAPGTLIRTADDLVGLPWDSPMAMKIVSPGIPHKTEAGGVLLNVVGPSEAEVGLAGLLDSARVYLRGQGSEAPIDGVLVTEMMPTPLAELLIGVRRVPGLGCVLTVGAGGTGTEVLGDVAHRVLPIAAAEVADMLSELRMEPLLSGSRGQAPVSRPAVSDLALAVVRFTLQDPSIAEVELNPTFVYADRAIPVDVLVVRRA
jgi:acetyltransferase